ncbi:MAG: DUF4248 domain-containing protein [Bacteroides sp.]|nr:DUF4248 domain-containing protein [Bacteroides sp.]
MEIKSYSKSYLARAYAPDIAPASAVVRLNRWIHRCRPLHEALLATGYYETQKVFTAKQVELIFYFLGSP